MRILLDTHTFLWAALKDVKLSHAAISAFESADATYLSSISAWEINTKYRCGKLPLPEDPATYIPSMRDKHMIQPLPFAEEDAFQLAKLPPIHRDPFDRMLIAQAIAHSLTILTSDRAITQYPVATLW